MSSKNNDNHIENEDIVYDDNSEFSNLSDATAKIKKLKEELKSCKEEKQEYLDGWQRSKADFLNLKKRSFDEIIESKERAVENFIIDLFPILDSFDMAFKDKAAWESAPAQWRKGIEYIYSQIQNVLVNNNIEIIDVLGVDFDPNKHDSVANIPTQNKDEEGKILEVVLKGYKIKEKILRPAHVKVGSFES